MIFNLSEYVKTELGVTPVTNGVEADSTKNSLSLILVGGDPVERIDTIRS